MPEGEPNWTPGPWHINQRMLVYAGKTPFDPHSKNSKRVADVSVSIAWRSSEEAEANARLIAAAPSMADYIKRRSDLGDIDATDIWEQINARS